MLVQQQPDLYVFYDPKLLRTIGVILLGIGSSLFAAKLLSDAVPVLEGQQKPLALIVSIGIASFVRYPSNRELVTALTALAAVIIPVGICVVALRSIANDIRSQ